MQGLMSSFPLTLPHVFQRAERIFPEKEVVTVSRGEKERITYGEWAQRTRRLAGRARRAGDLRGRPRGDVRLEHAPATWSSTSPRRAAAACCTR